ncbi:unnamed protein product [Gongylonema pulchrum]|uniref:Uncharacterized protein n=1 Tax=Gongylonema pulchrum TaxID=637853 RepID=A0A183DQD4_9BILA|nr:unnamed protein product [Gongylonema pulchrum]
MGLILGNVRSDFESHPREYVQQRFSRQLNVVKGVGDSSQGTNTFTSFYALYPFARHCPHALSSSTKKGAGPTDVTTALIPRFLFFIIPTESTTEGGGSTTTDGYARRNDQASLPFQYF